VGATTAEFLSTTRLFGGLPVRVLERVAEAMTPRTFGAGVAIAAEGASGLGFFVIEEGTANVDIGGQRVATLGPGEHFGEVAIFGGVDRTATVVAETDVRAHALAPWDFKPLVQENGEIAWRLLEQLARRLAER
jgi:CRP-like cAMP-binding protein